MKNYGVDVEELKAPKSKRIFRAWIEDWEKPLLKKNDVVAEIRLCEKYKGLTFLTLIINVSKRCMRRIWSGHVARGRMVFDLPASQ